MLYDACIIGGGPAGLAAALALSRMGKRSLVLDSAVYRNAKASHMHTVPTWDHRPAAEYRVTARKELDTRYPGLVTFVAGTATKLEEIAGAVPSKFKLQDKEGNEYEARKVILALGSEDQMPAIEGFASEWGKTIAHCPFCHGYEERGGPIGFLALAETENYAQRATMLLSMVANLSGDLTFFTNGLEVDAGVKAALTKPHKHCTIVIEESPVVKIEPAGADEHSGALVTLASGATKQLNLLYCQPPTRLSATAAAIAEQAGLSLTPSGDIVVTPPFNETSHKGIFAAGDCITPMKTVLLAISNGGIAGVAAIHAMAGEDLAA